MRALAAPGGLSARQAIVIAGVSSVVVGLLLPVLVDAISGATDAAPEQAPLLAAVKSWSWWAARAGIGVAAVAAFRWPWRWPASLSNAGVAAFALALALGVTGLLVPAVLLARRTSYEDVTGWTYPFLNKRWIGPLYALALGTFIVLPLGIRRLLTAPPEALSADPAPDPPRGWLWRVSGLFIVLAAVVLLAAPPWNVARHHRGIDFHEQVHLGPLQAIRKGHLPFVGPASTQYGPGSQLITYAYMSATGRFDIVGFREANLLFHFLTMTAVGVMAWATLGTAAALVVLAIGLAFSPLQFFVPQPDGTFFGAYGWGNGFRYLGALLVVPPLASRLLTPVRFGDWRCLGLGVVAGGFAWISQENLSATTAAATMVLVSMILTDTIPLRRAATGGVTVIAGAALFWLPVLGFYGWHGHIAEYLRNFMLVPRAVAVGFSNSWWVDATDTAAYRAFCWTTAVIVVLALLTLWQWPSVRLRYRLSAARVRLLSFLSVLAAGYATSLYRSDYSHFVNTLIALPFVIVISWRDLPALAAQTLGGRVLLRVALIAAILFIYPIAPGLRELYPSVVTPALRRFETLPSQPTPVVEAGPSFQRATRYLQDEPAVAPGMIAMRPFLRELSALHDLVGKRRTYITGLGSVYTGLVYFLADLTPAPYLFDRETMMINDDLRREHQRHFESRIGEVDCVIARNLEENEVHLFRRAYPDARVVILPINAVDAYVVIAK